MFRILFDGVEAGRSALENGDPPMGCAEGAFLPDPGFAALCARLAPEPDGDPDIQRRTGFSVATEDGAAVPCRDAVILSFDVGDGPEHRVDVIGIAGDAYERLFPGRYAAYEAEMRGRA